MASTAYKLKAFGIAVALAALFVPLTLFSLGKIAKPCTPTEFVRVTMAGNNYAIPVKFRPSFGRARAVKVEMGPSKFDPEFNWTHCQDKAELPAVVQSMTAHRTKSNQPAFDQLFAEFPGLWGISIWETDSFYMTPAYVKFKPTSESEAFEFSLPSKNGQFFFQSKRPIVFNGYAQGWCHTTLSVTCSSFVTWQQKNDELLMIEATFRLVTTPIESWQNTIPKLEPIILELLGQKK